MHSPGATYGRYLTGWIILGAIIFALLCWHAVNFTWDDPFISFRYAENLASGNGLVFNEGQRVEGYTNLLWVLIFSLFSLVGLSKWPFGLLIAAKILGIIIAIITFWLMMRTFPKFFPPGNKDAAHESQMKKMDVTHESHFVGYHQYFALIPVLLMMTSIYYAVWSVGALETTLFALLTLVANFIILGDINSGNTSVSSNIKRPILAGFIFFLVAITRADGFIIFTSAFLCLLIFTLLKRIRWAYLLHLTWAFLLPSLVVLGLRLSYYGDLLPNPFYLKAGFSLEHIHCGLVDLGQAFLYIHPDGHVHGLFGNPLPFILMFVPFLFRRTWRNPRIMLIGFQAGAYLLYIIYKGFDWMGMFRFFVHILPLLALLSGLGFAMLYSCFAKPGKRSAGYARKITTLFLSIIIVGSLLGGMKFFTTRIDHFVSGFAKWPPPLMLEYHRDMGFWLRDNARPGELVALGDAGAIPYFSSVTILDMMGLMDEHISRLKAEQYFQKFDVEYLLSHEPDWLMLMGYLEENGSIFKDLSFLVPYGVEVFEHPEFREHYRLAHQDGDMLMFKRLKDGDADPPGWQVEYDPLDRMDITLLGW